MKIPETIQVLGLNIKVVLDSNMTDFGEYNPNSLTIRINSNTDQQCQESTFIHEVIEAANDSLDTNLNHQTISSLESVLYQVIKQI